MLLTARYVVSVEGPVIEDGGVLVREGRIAAVGPAAELPSPSRVDYGDAVILPGFVNAHTHLELSFLAGRISPAMGFVPWIRGVAARLMAPAPARGEIEDSVHAGIDRSLAAGVTTVGDITRAPNSVRPVLRDSVLCAVSFGEVIGIGAGRDRWPVRLNEASSGEHQASRLRIGISPHAPYTVEPAGLRACADRALEQAAPLCIHVAETKEEDAFTRDLTGELVELLRGAGVWEEGMSASWMGPIELCAASGLLTPRTLLAHANYVSDADIQMIAKSGSSVAYCPRTHAAFGHEPHRFREMLAAGVNVCVGTDSLASNPSLSILDELRFLRRNHRDVSADELLALGTLRGAKALGLGDVAGSLTVGKSADLVVVPLEHADRGWESVLDETAPPLAVYVEGRQTSLLG